jgi:hypothetical protein
MVGGPCSTSGTRRGTLVTNPVKGLDYDYEKRNISVIICDTGLFWSGSYGSWIYNCLYNTSI